MDNDERVDWSLMDAWQQSVENRLSDLSAQVLDVRNELRMFRSETASQFRWLIGFLLGLIGLVITTFGGLLGVMARGFGRL